MADAAENLSPLQMLLDAAGAVVQEAKHHRRTPAAVVAKIAALEAASGPEVVFELKRIELQDSLLSERIDRATVIKLLDIHFEADNPERSYFHIQAKTTDYILRFFGEMFAMALGDADNYITTEMTLQGRGKEVTDRYELTIKKLLGLSPQEKYNDLLRRTQLFAGAVLAFLNQENFGGFDHPPHEYDLKMTAERLTKIDVPQALGKEGE
jgi:hypothetical protein